MRSAGGGKVRLINDVGLLLPQLLTRESVPCTGGAHVYKAVEKKYAIPHESLSFNKYGRVSARVFQVQNVNACDSRSKGWMKRFTGVARKCLPNYLGWRRMIEREGSNRTHLRVLSIVALGVVQHCK